jgi:biopolymer transport protein ExbD
MMSYRQKRHRKRSHKADGHLALIPFIDMMTIMVVFLLVHTADTDILPNTKSIQIPQSIAEKRPHETVVVMVTRDSIYVDGALVVGLGEVQGADAPIIEPLRAALKGASDRVLQYTGRQDISEREVTIMGDKSLPYELVKKLMATCTEADYGKVSLAVVEKERAAPAAGA